MRAHWLGLLCLFVAGNSLALDPPDHDKWQAGISAAQAAIARKDVKGVEDAIVVVFEQSIRMSDRDARLMETAPLIDQGMQVIEVADSHAHALALLKKLNAMTAVAGGLANPTSWTPAIALASALGQQRDFAGARAIMADMAKRAAADFGATHVAVRIARQQEAGLAAAMADYDAAVALLNEVAESVRRAFGASSAEYAEALVNTAALYVQREDFERASKLATEAYSLLQARPPSSIGPLLTLGSVFEQLGDLAEARDVYQRGDNSHDRVPMRAAASAPVLVRLAIVNARLGDGVAARSLMTRATEISRSVLTTSPGPYLEALFGEAAVYSMAGLDDQSVDSLGRIEALLPRLSSEQGTYVRRRLAGSYESARKYDRALALADELLRAASPGSADYASAAAIAARAAAQTDPPAPRTQLAQSALDLRKKLDPGREPNYELYTLALSYGAEGRWRESLDIQQRIIDREAKLGPYETNWTQWRMYATALEHVGRTREAAEVVARVAAETAPLIAALREDATRAQSLFIAERNAFGFKVDLTDAKWRRWSGQSVGWPMASFAAQYQSEPATTDCTIAVVPVLLPDGIDAETAIAGLLTNINHDRGLLKPWSKGPLKGYEYRFSATNIPGRPYVFTGRLLVEPRRMYLVLATAETSTPQAQAIAEAALDQVTLAEAPNPQSLRGPDRQLHSDILNYVATGLAGPGGHIDTALTIYETARQFGTSEALLQNIILANLRVGRFEVVRSEIDRYPGGPAAFPELLLTRALAEQRLGDAEAAIADYRAGFDAGVRDDEMAREYVTLLLDRTLDKDAVAFLDRYATKKSTPSVIAMQALVSFRVADEKRLTAALDAIEDPKRSSPEAVLVGAFVHKQRGGVDELHQFVDGLTVELVSAELYLILAAAQIEAKRLTEAGKTVALGRALAPANPNLKRLEEVLKAQQGPVL
jgi:hypothetical protein